MTLKALMADVDGVIVRPLHPWGWAATLEADLGLSSAQLDNAFFTPNWDDIIHGRAGLHERLAPVLAEIASHLTSQALADYWFARDSDLDTNLLEQIAALRARGVKAHLATVQEHQRARHLWEDLALRDHFDAMHYSAELGAAKPDAAFFEAIERRNGLAPEQMFFIDDKPANVEAAKARGWPAAVWTGELRLADLLSEAGIAVP